MRKFKNVKYCSHPCDRCKDNMKGTDIYVFLLFSQMEILAYLTSGNVDALDGKGYLCFPDWWSYRGDAIAIFYFFLV